ISEMIMTDSDTLKPVKPKTIAKSLAIGNPADGYYARDAVKASGGSAEIASDQDIRDGIQLLARTEGIFTETAGGVTVAVAKKLIEKGVIPKDESLVIAVTGNGLKTQDAIQDSVVSPIEIEPQLKSFEERVWANWGSRVTGS
ncbi:MAG: pyridoxal-phosphate dependent enzyme, partial [Candidatus Omnitrophica bacterium]|nr:pyridoxal-phosphate dependent enzyme [Candidatus Omnitrophota bacterium]